MVQQKNLPPIDVPIPIVWSQEKPRATPANIFVVHKNQTDEVVLFFAHMAPVIVGTPQEQLEQARALAKDKVRLVADPVVVLPLKVAKQLCDVLVQQLKST